MEGNGMQASMLLVVQRMREILKEGRLPFMPAMHRSSPQFGGAQPPSMLLPPVSKNRKGSQVCQQ